MSPRWGRGATQAAPAPMAAALPRGHRRCAPRRLKSTPIVHPSTPQTLAGRPFKSNPCLLSLFRRPWGKLPPNPRPRPRSRAGARRSREEGGEGGGEKRVEAVPGNRRPVELYLDAKPVRAAEVALVPELCGRGHFEGSAALGTPPSTGPRGTGTAQAKDDPAPFLCSERPLYFRLHCHRSAFFTDACTSASGHRGLDPVALQSPSCSHLTVAKSTPTTCSTKCRENKAELLSIFRLYTTATHLTHNVFVESPEQRQQA